MADGYFVSTTDVEQIEMLTGVHRRTMATTDEAMLCQFFLEKGAIVPTHQHMNDQVGYVISGKLEMTIGQEVHILTKGNSYAIPGGIPHSAKAVEDTWAIDVFSPPREDYRTEAR
ncbi:MAG: cupin domain-containing protein [Anaerolineae bacterium]|nr:cupin domain-containing protein [Anaerolineae bacterium]